MFWNRSNLNSNEKPLDTGGTEIARGTKETSKIPEKMKPFRLNRQLELNIGKYLDYCGNLCCIVDHRTTYGENFYKLKFLGRKDGSISDGWFKEDILRKNEDISNVENYIF
jgi:hypothetical protein